MDSVEVVRCILADQVLTDQVLALAAGGESVVIGSVAGGVVVGWGISFVVVKLVVDLVLQRLETKSELL
jgi:hypothetical protein